jgi:hypothetical protein
MIAMFRTTVLPVRVVAAMACWLAVAVVYWYSFSLFLSASSSSEGYVVVSSEKDSQN